MYLKKVIVKNSGIQGKGYFASEDIPLGTIVYFYSKDDIFYSKKEFNSLEINEMNSLMDKAVEDEFGNWVLTKTGPYTNHSCDPNIYPIFAEGNYFDIAVKNISSGDEITIDYSMFFSSTKWSMKCNCGSVDCRKEVGFGLDLDCKIEEERLSLITEAVDRIFKVKQPIFDLEDTNAVQITKCLKETKNIECVRYSKYSIISSE